MNSIAFHGRWIDQQHLIFNQRQLEDGYKFSDYNIQESTVIRFARQMEVFPISIQTRNRRLVRLKVTGSETIGDLKVRLWDRAWISRSKKIYSQLGDRN